LAGILLKDDEPEIVWSFGITRVVALLGMKYRYYPYPIWSDLKRDAVASSKSMKKNLLARVPRISAEASYYKEGNHIFLSVQPASREFLQQGLSQVPAESPLIINTWIDSARTHVWSGPAKTTRRPSPSLLPIARVRAERDRFWRSFQNKRLTKSNWWRTATRFLLPTARAEDSGSPGLGQQRVDSRPDGAILTIEWSSNHGLRN